MAFEFMDTNLVARPTKFFYKITLLEEKENTRRPTNTIVQTFYGKFENFDLSDSGLKYCLDSHGNYYYFRYFSVVGKQRFDARLTCSIDDTYSYLFKP